MSQSVCLRCGALKTGAWVACPECHHLPSDVRDRAKHLLASDAYLSASVLQSTSAAIRAGHPPEFPEAQVQAEIREIESLEQEGESSFAFPLVAATAVLLLLAAGAAWAWLA
ncbi:MAG: hypothetical protein HUU28_07060 [Planctomycetaceae bacterium]|jgi:hypothetical protein|nr:hypothetical protein [Planctomycetaceae bacterium]